MKSPGQCPSVSCVKRALQVGGVITENNDVICIQKEFDGYIFPEQTTRNLVACSLDCSGKSII